MDQLQATFQSMIEARLTASFECPILLVYGIILVGDRIVGEFPHYFPYHGILNDYHNRKGINFENSGSFKIQLRWYSSLEKKFYCYYNDFELDGNVNLNLTIGIYNEGRIILWEYSDTKSNQIFSDFGIDVTTETIDVLNNNSELINLLLPDSSSIEEITDTINIYNEKIIARYPYLNAWHGGSPSYKFTNRYNYKNALLIDIPMVKDVSLMVYYTDGSFDKRNSNELYEYQLKYLPKKYTLLIHTDFTEINIYFWFDTNRIVQIFHNFCRKHPETKTDFIIRIDAENKQYELALYRQGLKEPVVIPESAYQLIVFKNKFEDYRSQNYDQPRGAWIW